MLDVCLGNLRRSGAYNDKPIAGQQRFGIAINLLLDVSVAAFPEGTLGENDAAATA